MLHPRRLIHGGAVKLLHLRDAFACSEDRFNILYLVSSSQPRFAEDLVRACKARGIRFVWNQNGVGYEGWAGADAERHNAPMRRLRALADYVVYQSHFCRETSDKFLGSCAVPGEVLLNPVDCGKFRPGALLPKSPLRLLTLGTHNYAERVYSTVQCLRVLLDCGVDARLTIAGRLQWRNGEAGLLGEIHRRQLSSHVTILPAFSREQAPGLYQSHHVLLHAKYLDPCPTVVIEGMACGLPVVGSESGGVPELVPPQCGRLVPSPPVWDRMITPSGEQFAECVLEMLPRLEQFARSARVHAESSFEDARWVQKHDAIFRRLLV